MCFSVVMGYKTNLKTDRIMRPTNMYFVVSKIYHKNYLVRD